VRFFLDENFPGFQARKILSKYPGSIYAKKDSRFSGKSDQELYKLLCREPYVFISHDGDFLNPMDYPPGPTSGIIVIRTKGMRKGTAFRKLTMFLSSCRSVELKGTLVVIGKNSIRTRKF
jgi:hypothetical protein